MATCYDDLCMPYRVEKGPNYIVPRDVMLIELRQGALFSYQDNHMVCFELRDRPSFFSYQDDHMLLLFTLAGPAHSTRRARRASPSSPFRVPAIQKGTRVLISLWYSLMFGWVPGTRPNVGESHSEISTQVPFCIACSSSRPGASFTEQSWFVLL